MPKNLEIDMGQGKIVRIEFNQPVHWRVGDELLIRIAGQWAGFEIENTRTGEQVPIVVDKGFGQCDCGRPAEDATGYCDDCFGG